MKNRLILGLVLAALGVGFLWYTQNHGGAKAKASQTTDVQQQGDQQAPPPPPSNREDFKNFDMPGDKESGRRERTETRPSEPSDPSQGNDPPADAKR